MPDDIRQEVQNLRLALEMNNRLRLEVHAALSKVFREFAVSVSDQLLKDLTFAINEELPGTSIESRPPVQEKPQPPSTNPNNPGGGIGQPPSSNPGGGGIGQPPSSNPGGGGGIGQPPSSRPGGGGIGQPPSSNEGGEPSKK